MTNFRTVIQNTAGKVSPFGLFTGPMHKKLSGFVLPNKKRKVISSGKVLLEIFEFKRDPLLGADVRNIVSVTLSATNIKIG